MTVLGHFAMGRMEISSAHQGALAGQEIQGDDVKMVMVLQKASFSTMKCVVKSCGNTFYDQQGIV